MRENKFRAKNSNGEWIYFSILNKYNIWGIPTENIIDISTLCEFTGLHDKNGKEIYEGDRVCVETTGMNYRSDKITGTVKFIDGCFTVSFDEEVFDRTLGWVRNNLYVKCFVVNHAIWVI